MTTFHIYIRKWFFLVSFLTKYMIRPIHSSYMYFKMQSNSESYTSSKLFIPQEIQRFLSGLVMPFLLMFHILRSLHFENMNVKIEFEMGIYCIGEHYKFVINLTWFACHKMYCMVQVIAAIDRSWKNSVSHMFTQPRGSLWLTFVGNINFYLVQLIWLVILPSLIFESYVSHW